MLGIVGDKGGFRNNMKGALAVTVVLYSGTEHDEVQAMSLRESGASGIKSFFKEKEWSREMGRRPCEAKAKSQDFKPFLIAKLRS